MCCWFTGTVVDNNNNKKKYFICRRRKKKNKKGQETGKENQRFYSKAVTEDNQIDQKATKKENRRLTTQKYIYLQPDNIYISYQL